MDDAAPEAGDLAVEHGIVPIVCVGERLEVRKEGNQVPYVLDQVTTCLKDLTAERVGLNFAQRMSGIATLTSRYVAEVAKLICEIEEL